MLKIPLSTTPQLHTSAGGPAYGFPDKTSGAT